MNLVQKKLALEKASDIVALPGLDGRGAGTGAGPCHAAAQHIAGRTKRLPRFGQIVIAPARQIGEARRDEIRILCPQGDPRRVVGIGRWRRVVAARKFRTAGHIRGKSDRLRGGPAPGGRRSFGTRIRAPRDYHAGNRQACDSKGHSREKHVAPMKLVHIVHSIAN